MPEEGEQKEKEKGEPTKKPLQEKTAANENNKNKKHKSKLLDLNDNKKANN